MKNIPLDKQAHFLSGAVLVFMLTHIGGHFANVNKVAIWALVFSIAVGAWKEWWWDARHPTENTVDFYDFLATSLGGLFAFLVIIVT